VRANRRRWGRRHPLLKLRADRRWTLFVPWTGNLAYDIFTKYADSLVDAIYEEDQHVENDVELQDFYVCLNTLFETVPDRYNAFRSKAGIKRFLSDTINHLVVGHEFYGTTGVSGATDPRVIMVSTCYSCRVERIDPKLEHACLTPWNSCYWQWTQTQVPKDGPSWTNGASFSLCDCC
jgi:hypothetical protein